MAAIDMVQSLPLSEMNNVIPIDINAPQKKIKTGKTKERVFKLMLSDLEYNHCQASALAQNTSIEEELTVLLAARFPFEIK